MERVRRRRHAQVEKPHPSHKNKGVAWVGQPLFIVKPVRESGAGHGVDGEEIFQQRLEQLEIQRVGAVGLGVGRVVVDLNEETVDAGGDGSARHQGNEFRLATTDAVGGRGLLHGVGGIKNDRREAAHDGERAEIDNQIVVAEGRAALGEEDALITRGADFLDAVAHIAGRDELAFFDVYGTACFAGGHQQVSLATQKRGNLEDVDSFGGDIAVGGLVNVGEDGQAGVFSDAAKNARALRQARPSKTLHAGAVGFVVAGFEDEGDTKIGGDALDGLGHGARVGFGLDDAGSSDEEKPARTHLHRPDFKGVAHEGNSTRGRVGIVSGGS